MHKKLFPDVKQGRERASVFVLCIYFPTCYSSFYTMCVNIPTNNNNNNFKDARRYVQSNFQDKHSQITHFKDNSALNMCHFQTLLIRNDGSLTPGFASCGQVLTALQPTDWPVDDPTALHRSPSTHSPQRSIRRIFTFAGSGTNKTFLLSSRSCQTSVCLATF